MLPLSPPLCPFTLRALEASKIFVAGSNPEPQMLGARCVGDMCAAFSDGACIRLAGIGFITNNLAHVGNALGALVAIQKALAEVEGVKFPDSGPARPPQ